MDDLALKRMFDTGRSHGHWLAKPVSETLLRQVYDLVKLAPTSVNCQPARFTFVITEAAKARLLPAMAPANAEKVLHAPATVIVATDSRFHEHLPRLFHHRPEISDLFAENAALARETAERNATLQGGYFILAARALGLDCGPMSGFEKAQVDAEFFPDGRLHSNFLINLGHGDPEKLFPRLPRLSSEEACQFL
ncbi:malonic semialdehyde reductase [Ensifer sp. NM-2]|uniref:malonic semialdehyde reductase n=1 Tax=Ensifer sp. NM-2 TaxID=2109730 RepID=UPI000D122A8E|nr:malonic semialdehyde reductase [Ensifer sp. NM-2]PSS60592.1 malonic semialdehyde reductase [Ensifer sp. NM-2]